jgi:hypothetical protein
MDKIRPGLVVLAAFGFGALLTIGDFRRDQSIRWVSLALLVVGFLLEIRADSSWWRQTAFFASILLGRLVANWWLSHGLRSGSIFDDFAWVFLLLTIYSLINDGRRSSRVRLKSS